MIARILTAGCLCVLPQLHGCDADTSPIQETLVTFDTECDKSNEGKRVALEGFLNFPEKFNAKAPLIVVRLQAAPTRTGKVVGASMRLNAGTNSVTAPPDKYNEQDLRATTSDRKTVYYTTRVKVTGEMLYSNSLDSLAFKCFLTNTQLEVTGTKVDK